MYDLVAGGQGLTMSRYMTPTESRRQFPTLAERGPSGRELKGTARAPASPAGPVSLPRAAGRAPSLGSGQASAWLCLAAAACPGTLPRSCPPVGCARACAAPPCTALALAMGAAQRVRIVQAALLTEGRWQLPKEQLEQLIEASICMWQRLLFVAKHVLLR